MRKEIRPLLKSFLLLSLPTVAEQILSTLFQYVDTAMVGRLGEEATASVSVTSTIGWLVGSVIYGGGAAILTLTARAYGAKDREKGEKLSSLSLILSLIFGVLIGGISILLSPHIPVWMGADVRIRDQASRYFTIISLPMFFRSLTALCGSAVRGAQDTRRPMLISVLASVMNVILDYILIYPCGYGVDGAAAATALCLTFSGIMNLLLMRRTPFLRGAGYRMPDRQLVRECLQLAFPVMGISCVTCMGYVVFAGLVSGMGTTIFAAHSIAVTAETVFYIPGYGLRTATTALTGAAVGEGNGEKFSIYCRIAAGLTVGMMVLSGIALYFCADWLMGLFTPSERVVQLGAQMLRLVAFSEPFFGLYVVLEGIYYGMGQTRYPFWVEAVSIWGVRILFTYLCVRVWNLGLLEVWYCMIADNVTKALLLFAPFLKGGKRGFRMDEDLLHF
jgi:putative MATE family efflux protein